MKIEISFVQQINEKVSFVHYFDERKILPSKLARSFHNVRQKHSSLFRPDPVVAEAKHSFSADDLGL